MICLHWELQNTFEHYGPGDFGMLGWDALKPDAFSLFHFEELEAEQMRKQLLDAMRHALANETAARFSDLDQVILRLAQEKEIEILSPEGKARLRTLRRLRATDRIAFPDTLLLPGISRLR